MPSIILRICLFYNIIYSIFLYLLPKKLKHYFSKSYNQIQQPINDAKSTISHPLTQPRSGPARMDPNELMRIFQMFDKNGDGRITKQELNDSLENMNIYICDNDLVQMIEKIDVNNDGCVDIDEFGELYKSIMDDRENEEDMMQAFNVFDINGDGFIAVEELRAVLESLGLKQGRKAEDCRKMIMKVDVDGDGMVSFDEFKEMMRSGGFAAMAKN
ncbi:calmodulin-like protein 3 [Tanacetum coccineum]